MTIDARLASADDTVVVPAGGLIMNSDGFAFGPAFAAALEVLPAHLTILDARGTILYVNEAWRRFAADNALRSQDFCVGQNYLTVCETANGDSSDGAASAAAGIRAVLTGELPRFVLDYPCHGPDEPRWFRLLVAPVREDKVVGAVVMHVDITGPEQDAHALRVAERVARESEQRLSFALEAADIGDWSLDLRTNLAHRSLRHDQCFGYTALLPEWSYDTFLAHIDPADRASVDSSFKRALAGAGEYNDEFKTTWPDGSVHWLWTRGRVYFDDLGAPIRMAGIVVDITERKRSQMTEQLAVDRLNEAQRIAKIGDWSWEITTQQITWSAQVFEIMGRDPLAGPPSGPDELASVYDASSLRIQQEHIVAAISSGEPQEYELVIIRPDGEQVFTQVMALPRKDDTGKVVTLYGTIQDISERKRAEMDAVRLASIVASSDDAIIGKTLNSTVTSWNRGAQKIFGYTAEEMVGHSILRIIPTDRLDEEEHIIGSVSRGESVEHFETQRLTKDGRQIDVSITASPILDATGTVLGVSKVARDISERKKLEQQFLRAQRMESIGTLAGGIAHDLNNVLGPIMLSLELLKMSFPDAESQELIGVIEGSARHGSAMVKQVLSFARGVEGQRLEIDVVDLLHDIEKISKDTFLKHIETRTIVPPELWRVVGDPTQLHQVLLNLCVNARDAMPDGGTLTIAADNVAIDAHYAGVNLDAKAGLYVVLRVEDSGTGIRPDVLERIFDPFFTTKEIGKGTGLGLSTSMAIVKSHGGFIRAYSELGRGSKFNVYIPARVEATAERGVPVSELPRGHGELVLVVDDEPAVRQITQQTLEAFGYRVVVAVDGADAVATYAQRSGEIAVVLTDMMMPVMDGPATIRVLRKMNPAVRIVAASGLDANAHGVGLGISYFLPKPYAADRLLTTLRQILADRR
ncbi:PAS domain-containing hybrid sensor histidine kinase/response regulator [Gemmatimonas groenlandica]|uniref:histidine kinase n=1 Tax=Gemmatimonas groenlandica TaxID=2732249 RepID=A0A6M4IP88_9BACT|nr:PAS domain S-box protein [Gemmatimonas groenlandica]QJR36553.1 PAS domain S-box protein [Gemmatimonas groenlandica]